MKRDRNEKSPLTPLLRQAQDGEQVDPFAKEGNYSSLYKSEKLVISMDDVNDGGYEV